MLIIYALLHLSPCVLSLFLFRLRPVKLVQIVIIGEASQAD